MVSHNLFLIFTNFVLSDCLQAEHDRKKKMRQNKTDEQRKQRQKDLQKKFEEDLENYKEGLLQVPKQHDPDASLVITYSFSIFIKSIQFSPNHSHSFIFYFPKQVSVDLDDPSEDANGGEALEAFLNQPDILYDVSPLPKDETPLKKEDISELPPKNLLNVETPTPTGSAILSREDSYYTPNRSPTPDATTDKLSEINLND